MIIKTRSTLLAELNSAVRSAGQGPKTTAQDVRTFLASIVDEIINRSVDSSATSLSPDLLQALVGTAGMPSETNPFVTALDPRLVAASTTVSMVEFVFETGFADNVTRMMGIRQAGRYHTQQLQNVAQVTYLVNDVLAALPFSVSSGDTLEVRIVRSSAAEGAIVGLET